MARITIDLPDDLAQRLSRRAQEEGVAEAALIADAVRWRTRTDDAFDPDQPDAERLERIAQGLRQLDAGQGISHATAMEWLETLATGPKPPLPR